MEKLAIVLLVACILGGVSGPSRAAQGTDQSRVDGEAREVYLELTRRLEGLVDQMSSEQRARASAHASQLREKAEDFYRKDAESFEQFQAREQEAYERMKRGEPRRPETPEPERETPQAIPEAEPPPAADPEPEPATDRLQPPAAEPDPEPVEPLPEAAPAPTAPRDRRASSPGSLPIDDRQVLLAEGVRRFSRAMVEASQEHALRPNFLLCVMRIESAYDTRAVSRAGALGLMQLMPGTAEDLGVNPYDLRENILGGAKLIDENLRLYDGDVRLAMAAYNAGRGAVKKYGGVPPYPETKDYVARVERDCGSPRP